MAARQAVLAAGARVQPTASLRTARRAWRLLHIDSVRAIEVAEQALALAQADGDRAGEAWARLVRGFHLLFFFAPSRSLVELRRAQKLFDAVGDRSGFVMAGAGIGRAMWRQGRFGAALKYLLSLREEGLRVLSRQQRAVLLNAIAGGYSVQGHADQAFAYMYEAMRHARPSRGYGFDAILHCNLAHELSLLGDHDAALRHVEEGLSRCAGLRNPRLIAALLINRVVSLTELDRAAEALPDVRRIVAIPADATGRGLLVAHFESLALAALKAGDVQLGRELVERAERAPREAIPEEHVEMAQARALLALSDDDAAGAELALSSMLPLVADDDRQGLSLRARCQHYLLLADVQERLGQVGEALASMRAWQLLQTRRAKLASSARYQAAELQTELLRLQHQLDANDAKRRATERARAELVAINDQLSRKVEEVQALQARLKEQATRDDLTGLFNRRHLNDTLPAMFALARRDAQPLSVAILDLDHFKLVNDEHGHSTGDALLAAFGALLAEGCRRSDVACRYGGEEFCLLMPRTDAASARRKVLSLLRRWHEQRFDIEGATLTGLSFSAGVADTILVPGTAADLLHAADDELLAAKRLGRHRVRCVAAKPSLQRVRAA